MKDEIKEIKIGMYTTNEILEFMTNGEGHAFMGRSMYDAIIDYITNLQKERNMFKGAFETMTENYFEENKKINKAIEYNKALCKIYDCGIELSNAETNLCILKDEETINLLQGRSDE